MANKLTYVVQAFELKRGKLVPGPKEPAPTPSGALKKAEAVAKRMAGAIAICVNADGETGEVDTITALGQFGQVPDDFVEGLTAS